MVNMDTKPEGNLAITFNAGVPRYTRPQLFYFHAHLSSYGMYNSQMPTPMNKEVGSTR